MSVVVDTSVWSLALRRARGRNWEIEERLVELIDDGRVVMIGAIREELLSGVKGKKAFEELREHLRHFPDVVLCEEDYEVAAECYNRCRARGIQGSNTDFLICAVALHNDFEIYTQDKDFPRYSKVLGVVLHG